MRTALALVTLLVSTVASAAQYEWFKLETATTYRDIGQICTNEVTPTRLYLRVTFEGDRAVEAILKEGETVALPGAAHTYLTTDELAGLAFDRDSRGKRWLHEISLTPRLIGWVLFNAWGLCRPNEAFRTIAPERPLLRFTRVELVPPFSATTEKLEISGTTVSGRAFGATIAFTESLIEIP